MRLCLPRAAAAVAAGFVILPSPFPLCHTCLWTCLSCFSSLLSSSASEQDLPGSCSAPAPGSECREPTDVWWHINTWGDDSWEKHIPAWGQLHLPKGHREWLRVVTASAPNGTCGSPSSLSRAGTGRWLPGCSQQAPWWGSLHFKPPQQTHLLPSKSSLQPVEEGGAPRAGLIPPASLQLTPSGPSFSPLAVKKVQGASSGVGIHAVKADEMCAAFHIPKCGNWETPDVTILQPTPLEMLSVHVCSPFWNAENLLWTRKVPDVAISLTKFLFQTVLEENTFV